MADAIKEKQMTFMTGIVSSFKNSAIKSVEDVPIMNEAAYKTLVGEDKVYEFVNTVMLGENHPAIPDPWTTVVLTEDWANSFVNSMKASPKPLFIPGHADYSISAKMRAIPDGYMTGGLVKDSVLYLRNTLIMSGAEQKKALIEQTAKEIKANMLSTSTSDYMKFRTEVDEDDNVTYFATESVKGQSNAIVEADMTGSEADIIITSFKATDGSNDKKQGEEHMAEKTTMTNDELFTSLKNQLDSGRLALSTVAESLGIDLMTSKQKAALKRLNDAESKVGDISEFVLKIETEKKEAFAALKEAKLKEKFNTEELIEIAEPLFSLKEGNADEIQAEVDRIAEMKVFKAIQGKIAANAGFSPAKDEDLAVENEAVMEG